MGRALVTCLSVLGLAGCGDPMLPSNFTGEPAGAVTARVLSRAGATEAERPRLTVEWLGTLQPGKGALLGQPVSYQRSEKLQTDWDIGLGLPLEKATLELSVGERRLRVAIGKVVYFDDRVADDRLDWTCRTAECDRVKAVSEQYVLFVETPVQCDNEAEPRLRLGYHYYTWDWGTPREMGLDESMSFTLNDRAPAEVDPSLDLRAFAGALQRLWTASGVGACN